MQRLNADTDAIKQAAASADRLEWPTLALIAGCYAAWLAAGVLYAIAPLVGIVALALAIALHSSLQHEAIHHHPTRHRLVNEALMFLPLGLLIPYRRYRELHLMHHADSRVTDPYDDPESFYIGAHDFARLPRALRMVLRWNNMLGVRVVIGPALAAAGFLLSELRASRQARGRAAARWRRAWLSHGLGLLVLGVVVHLVFAMPIWAYCVAAYLALSLLAVRSFCEHQWADRPDDRTVIVERSLLSGLFLNNNLHLVHHKHPGLPWYRLPAAYRARRGEWHAMNGGYVFASYGAVMREFGLRAKEPVTHPARRSRSAQPAGSASMTARIAAKS